MDWGKFVLDLMGDDLDLDDIEGDFEKRMSDFDYEKDASDLLYSFIQPQLEDAWKTLRANDEEVKQIYRRSGLSDVEIAWKKYDRARFTRRDNKRMPEEFVIRKFIVANRAEVKSMLLTEYNEEKVMEKERQEGANQERVKVASKMVNEGGMTASFISKMTEMSEEAVRNLAKSMGVSLA